MYISNTYARWNFLDFVDFENRIKLISDFINALAYFDNKDHSIRSICYLNFTTETIWPQTYFN